jgi:hypothetical protein
MAFTFEGRVLLDVRELSAADRRKARGGKLGTLYVATPLTAAERHLVQKKIEDALAEAAALLVGGRSARQLRRRRTTARKRTSVAS